MSTAALFLLIAQTDTSATTGVDLTPAWIVTAIALAGALVLDRWLPLGVCQGWLATGLSALLLLNYRTGIVEFTDDNQLSPATGFAALAAFWLLVTLWVERQVEQEPNPASAPRHAVRQALGNHVALLAGLVAVPLALIGAGGSPTLFRATVLAVLALLAAGFAGWRGSTLARYAAWGCVAVGVVMGIHALPAWRWLPLCAFGAAMLALLLLFAIVVVDWRRRIHVWQTDVQSLVEPPPGHPIAYGFVLVLACVAALTAVAALHPLSPLTLLLATFAIAGVGHRKRSNRLGELGLACGGLAAYAVAAAWLPATWGSLPLGVACGGTLLLWLARFWHQQLDDGRAWTTAGRLVPHARQLGVAAAGGYVMLLGWQPILDIPLQPPLNWGCLLALAFIALHASMLVKDAARQRSSAGAMAACISVLAFALLSQRALAPAYGIFTPALALAAGGLLLAVRVMSGRANTDETAWVYNAYVMGMIPVLAAYALTLDDASRGNAAAWALPVIVLGAGVALRVLTQVHWGRRVAVHA